MHRNFRRLWSALVKILTLGIAIFIITSFVPMEENIEAKISAGRAVSPIRVANNTRSINNSDFNSVPSSNRVKRTITVSNTSRSSRTNPQVNNVRSTGIKSKALTHSNTSTISQRDMYNYRYDNAQQVNLVDLSTATMFAQNIEPFVEDYQHTRDFPQTRFPGDPEHPGAPIEGDILILAIFLALYIIMGQLKIPRIIYM